MSHIKEITLYQFDELSAAAKDKARDWYRNASAGDNFWSKSVIEDAANVADILGIDLRQRPAKLMSGGTRTDPAIYWSGFWSQGDGACFEGNYAYAKGAAKKIREYAPQDAELHRIANELQALQSRYFYALQCSMKTSGRYSHSGTMQFNVWCDRDNSAPLTDDAEETLPQLMRDFADWIYRQLEKEYEYQNSDECVDETIRANEYEFNENGTRA